MPATRCSPWRAALMLILLQAASCSFPDYLIPGETSSPSASSAGGAATTSVGSTDATSSATSASSGGAGGVGGATTATTSTTGASSSTGTGPTTCAQTCDTGAGAMCSPSCDGSADPACDCDGDGEILDTAACKAAHVGAKVDCYDCNPSAKHGVTGFFIVDRGDGEFDYDCSNIEEPQYDASCGEGMLTCDKPYRFGTTPGCGKNGDLYACNSALLMSCTKASLSNLTPQACH